MPFDNLKKIFEQSSLYDTSKPEIISNTMHLTTRTIQDIDRVSNWLISPSGVSFVLTRQGQALTEPRLETSISIPTNRKRIFNPVKFLANFASPITGVHTSTHGLVDDYSYEQVQSDKIQQDQLSSNNYKNRLIQLSQNQGLVDRPNIHLSNKSEKIQTGILDLVSGPGGPNSLYGIGNTIIRTATGGLIQLSTIELQKRYELFHGYTDQNSYEELEPKLEAISKNHQDNLDNNEDTIRTSTGGTPLASKTEQQDAYNLVQNYDEQDTYQDNIEQTGSRLQDKTDVYKTENPGYKGSGFNLPLEDTIRYNTYKDISDIQNSSDKIKTFEKGAEPGTDIYGEYYFSQIYPSMAKSDEKYFQKWNAVDRVGLPERGNIPGTGRNDVFYADPDGDTPNATGLHGRFNDFIKFRFESSSTGGAIQFRNTMTNFSPKFEPEWNEIEYIGRPDPLYIYKGFKRSLSLTLMIAIQSSNEYSIAWQKINNLIQKASPIIDNNGIMSSPVVFLTIGSMYKNTPCIITNIDPEIDDSYPWDIITETPQYISFGLSFNVLGNDIPSTNTIYFNT